MSASIGLYSRRGGGGHFDTFAGNISRLLAIGGHSTVRIESRHEALIWPGLLLVLDADYDRQGYVSLALRRMIKGRPTLNMLWRTVAQEPSQNNKLVKQLFYALADAIPLTRSLAVVSARSSGSYRSHEIVDSEYWDLLLPDRFPLDEKVLSPDISKALGNEKAIVLAIGGLRYDKGAQFLIDAWCERSELREKFSLVVAGVREDIVERPDYEEVGISRIARRLSDAEWMALLNASSVVWACYAPSYDRSSGVAGRALQLSKWLTIRRGSLLEAELGETAKCVMIDYGKADSVAHALQSTLNADARPAYDARTGQAHSLKAFEAVITALGASR
jgi:hypothetical protein